MVGIVVLSGPPGAGKTTLGRKVASRLRATFLSKDSIKEVLHEPLGISTADESVRASVAAMRLMYAITEMSHALVVLETVWKPDLDEPQLLGLDRPMVQLFCEAPAQMLEDRLVARIRTGERHPVHRDVLSATILASMIRDCHRPQVPLALGSPTLHVDTSGEVDVDSVAEWVQTHLASGVPEL